LCVPDAAAPRAGGVQEIILRCERERRSRMREIFPLTGIAVFQVDKEVERAGRPSPDHVGKGLQSLALGHRWDNKGTFSASARLVHGCSFDFMSTWTNDLNEHMANDLRKIWICANLIFWDHKM
jgi:hypothetical protein